MFDAEMIRMCAQMYPVEFFGLCALTAIMVPIGAALMYAMAVLVIGEE